MKGDSEQQGHLLFLMTGNRNLGGRPIPKRLMFSQNQMEPKTVSLFTASFFFKHGISLVHPEDFIMEGDHRGF